ncbi:MAG TPA: amidohydrolase [Mycobacteriales bacterium]|nr:amidohydrolase [Mycobacteriales bacterium]
MTGPSTGGLREAAWLDRWLLEHGSGLITFRRELHQNPELGYEEHRTTARLAGALSAAGLHPHPLPTGTGLFCDVGTGDRVVALRADIDALPLQDVKEVPYASSTPGVCHACGHDAHTTIVLGAALALASGPVRDGRVRVVFQPAEEAVPGGALDAIDGGVLKDVERIFALHCDPKLETGRVGLRAGAITAACDKVDVLLSGPGGHTARPHTTVDLVYALGRVIADAPGLLSRRADPRHGMSLVWGAVQAGVAPNTIPQHGMLTGTVRMLDRDAWEGAEEMVRTLVEQLVAPTGAAVDVQYLQGVPPVSNDAASTAAFRAGITAALGADAVADTEQSLGGEDFAWYLSHVPGALARLGVRPPGDTGPYLDLHQPTFDIDEDALAVGVRVLVHTALTVLG